MKKKNIFMVLSLITVLFSFSCSLSIAKEYSQFALENINKDKCNKKNDVKTCFKIGKLILLKNSNYLDKESFSYLKKSCDMEYGPACFYIGLSYFMKKMPGANSNMFKANINLNEGELLNYLTKGIQLSEKDCNKGDKESCYIVGLAYSQGLKVDKNKQKALNFLKKAISFKKLKCENGDAIACYEVGNVYVEEGDLQKAKEYYKKSCNLNLSLSCFVLGSWEYFPSNEPNSYLEKACNLGNIFGCMYLGMNFYKNGDIKTAKYYFRKSCQLSKNEIICQIVEEIE